MVRKRRLVVFLFVMLVSRSDGSVSRTDIPEFPEDLGELCPYTSFCNTNASHNFQTIGDKVPCCQTCSCDSSCGLHNNCCYKHLDIYNISEKYRMVCKSSVAIRSKIRRPYRTHYRMINKCLQPGKPTKLSIQTDKIDFYPVFSRKTGFIYFNIDIATCNNINDTIPLRKAIICSSAKNYFSGAARLIRGEEPETDCFLEYIYPNGVDLKTELCEPNVIRKCNVTGKFSESKPFWEFCEAFNATFVSQKFLSTYWYGNIYCFLCNERIDYRYRDKCSPALYDLLEDSKLGKLSMTAVLDTRIQSNEISTKTFIPGANGCPVNEVMIESLSTRCRQIQCPLGKIRVGTKCEYHSEQWVGGPFVVLLRLTPFQEDIYIPMSVFQEMSEQDRDKRKAKWLKRNAMKNWIFLTLYHPSSDNASIEFIVVKANYPSFSVDPNAIENMIKTALEDSWQISHKSETIALKISLNAYISYQIVHLEEKGMFANGDFAYFPEELFSSGFHNEVLYQVSKFPVKKFEDGILLTKLFFCEQVDLLAEEFEDGIDNIFFKVKNITLSSLRFTRVEIASNIAEKQESVRICVSEFQPESNFGTVEKTMLCPFCVLFVITHSLVRFI